ncbi:MAG: TrkA family potassium uptake protein [Candidatus Riflebacteria bacterium]|nr:TrkA family potassium uptake protein [Candidatus Riflebacteria bacterium]
MTQQIIVIGLGHFGMSLARSLAANKAEVLAVDNKKALVEEAAKFATEAIWADATDELELAELAPGKRDISVCAIGEESRESSIICTALLRQMGSKKVVARANTTMHQRILKLVGAHQIINPEQEFGVKFANKLLYSDVIADTSISDDLNITEISVQPLMVGKTLIELELPKKFGVIVAGIRDKSNNKIIQPLPNVPLKENESIVIVSNEASIRKLLKGV